MPNQLHIRLIKQRDKKSVIDMIRKISERDYDLTGGGFPDKRTLEHYFEEWVRIHGTPYRKIGTRKFSSFEYYFSFYQGEPVGFIFFSIEPRKMKPEFKFGTVWCYIRPKFRRRGFGTRQLELIKHEMRKWGYDTFRATVLRDNEPSIKMFEEMGAVREDYEYSGCYYYQF